MNGIKLREMMESDCDATHVINMVKSVLHPDLFKAFEGTQEKDYCGVIFLKGDVVYSCKDCGIDNTCVMCALCYKNSCHENHDVSFHISEGNGVCDCGDLEAWKIPLNCKMHTLTNK